MTDPTSRSAPESRVELLARALLFYADPGTYEESAEPHPTRFGSGNIPIEADRGALARAWWSGWFDDDKEDE